MLYLIFYLHFYHLLENKQILIDSKLAFCRLLRKNYSTEFKRKDKVERGQGSLNFFFTDNSKNLFVALFYIYMYCGIFTNLFYFTIVCSFMYFLFSTVFFCLRLGFIMFSYRTNPGPCSKLSKISRIQLMNSYCQY